MAVCAIAIAAFSWWLIEYPVLQCVPQVADWLIMLRRRLPITFLSLVPSENRSRSRLRADRNIVSAGE
jgi:hypothetical protein